MSKHKHKALERRIDRLEKKLQKQRKKLKSVKKQLTASSSPAPSIAAKPKPKASVNPTPKAAVKPTVKPATKAKKSIADDLTAITGIGPATQAALQSAGITTYEQLATMSSDAKDTVANALGSFGDRINRDGWIEQARALLRQ